MELSSIGRAVLVAREGRRLVAYPDSVGVMTIGIGCTEIDGRPVPRGLRITDAECDALFEVTVARYVAAVNRGLRVAVTQNAFDALVSVCYNIGIGRAASGDGVRPAAGFLGATFLRRLNAGDRDGAREAILWWRRPAAILTRRQAEAEQFATPYAERAPRATSRSAPVSVAGPVQAPVIPRAPSPSARLPWGDAVAAWMAALFGPSTGHGERPSPPPRG